MRSNDCATSSPEQRKEAKLKIRLVRKSDRVCTAKIDEDCFNSAQEEFKSTKTEKVVVAIQAKMVIGYIRFSIEDDQIYLANVCTASDARGESVCQQMVSWLIDKLPKYDRKKISLYATNSAAVACYEKVGFKESDGGSDMVYTMPRKRRKNPRKRSRRKSASKRK